MADPARSTLTQALPNHPPALFSSRRLRHQRARSQKTFLSHDFLYQQVEQNLKERLSELALRPIDTLIMGARNTTFSDHCLPGKGIYSDCVSFEFTTLVHDLEVLPFHPTTFDLVISPLYLHWANDLPGVLAQLRASLKPGGVLLGALLGGETLIELRHCLLQAESELDLDVGLHTAPTLTYSDLASLLQRTGFIRPVVDIDTTTVFYDTVRGLMHDLRGMGEASKLRHQCPLNRSILEKTTEYYRTQFGTNEGLPTTFNLLYFTAWA